MPMIKDPFTDEYVSVEFGGHLWSYRGHKCRIQLDFPDDDGTLKAWHFIDDKPVNISPYCQTKQEVEDYIDKVLYRKDK